jgi:hypothetical protein
MSKGIEKQPTIAEGPPMAQMMNGNEAQIKTTKLLANVFPEMTLEANKQARESR